MAERDDRGFTLIEVVVVTVLLGLVSLVIGFAITTVLRVTPTTESDVDDARSVQGLTAWFPNDAASAEASSSDVLIGPSTLSCSGVPAGGDNLVEFQWTVTDPTPTTYVAIYRLEPDGEDRSVRRYECSGTGAGPFSGTAAQKLTGPLDNFSAVTATPSFDQVTLALRSLDGSPIDIEATPRNPSDSLPPVSVPATVPPATGCSVTFDHLEYPDPPPVARDGLDQLSTGVTIGMDVLGPHCGLLTIRFETGSPISGIQTRVVTQFGATRGFVTLPKGDGDPTEPYWAAGNHLIEVFNNCPDVTCTETPLDTAALVVS